MRLWALFWCKAWYFQKVLTEELWEQKHTMLLCHPVPLLATLARTQREVDTFFPYCVDPVQRNRLSALNLCRETSLQLIIWFWSQEKWIHFHFLGLPLKLLREDNYFLSSKYFLTSFSLKWQSGSAPGWQIQPQFDGCNSEHSPRFNVSFHGSKFSFARWIVIYFWKTFIFFNFNTKRGKRWFLNYFKVEK